MRKGSKTEVGALSHEVRFTLLADMHGSDAKVRKVPSPEVSRFIDHFVGGFFLDKASRLYDQKASVPVIVEPYYGSDRDLIAFLGVGFGLTGKSKRNLINVLK